MNKTEQLQSELEDNLKVLLNELGIQPSDDKMGVITSKFISSVSKYEQLKESILTNSKEVLRESFKRIPKDIREKINSQIKEKNGRD